MVYGYPPPMGTVTGEAVALELRPARLGSRTLAFGIDVIVQLALLFGVSIAYVALPFDLDSDLAGTLSLVLFLGVALGYPVLLETLWRGRTLGKAAVGLRVLRDDGGPAPFTSIVVRNLVGLIIERPGVTLGIAGVASMTASERAKRLGDMWAGTVVVAERVPGRESVPVVMPPPLAAWASTVDLSRVSDSLGLGIRQFLGRAAQLDPGARERVGSQLAAQLASVTSPPPPPGTPGWAFLTAILAERRRRDELTRRPPMSVPAAMPPPYLEQQPPAPPAAPPPPGPGGFSAPV
jgi:uncharacterized RDD family membrane protein YckC